MENETWGAFYTNTKKEPLVERTGHRMEEIGIVTEDHSLAVGERNEA